MKIFIHPVWYHCMVDSTQQNR